MRLYGISPSQGEMKNATNGFFYVRAYRGYRANPFIVIIERVEGVFQIVLFRKGSLESRGSSHKRFLWLIVTQRLYLQRIK